MLLRPDPPGPETVGMVGIRIPILTVSVQGPSLLCPSDLAIVLFPLHRSVLWMHLPNLVQRYWLQHVITASPHSLFRLNRIPAVVFTMLTKAWHDATARLLARTPVRPELSLTGALSSELSHRRLLNQCVRFATMISDSFIDWSNSNWSDEVTGCTITFTACRH